MGSEWTQRQLADVALIRGGQQLAPNEFRPDGRYLVYGSNSIMGRTNRKNTEGPFISFARVGSNCGAVMYSEDDGWVNNNASRITGRGEICEQWLYYALSSSNLAHLRSGSGQPFISASALGQLVLDIPLLEEQRAIAEVLGSIDDRIVWCVNLGEKCAQTQAALFAELRENATGVRLGDWAFLDKGVSYKGDFISKSKFDEPLINLGLFGRSSRVRWENLKRYSGPVKERHKVYSSDVVVCATDMTQDRAVLGSVAIVPQWLAAASITHHLYALRLREGAPFPAWMAGSAISHEPTRRRLAEAANGTTVLALPKDIIEDIEVPVLSGSELQAADGMFWALQRLIESLESEQSQLSQLRDALLPQLVSGELRIEDPERLLDQAA